MEELLEWVSSRAEHNVNAARLLLLQLGSERKRIEFRLAANRNRLILLQIDIQTITMGLGMCSMVSGFFGMNLGNSICGPDGCIDYLTDPNNPSGWSSSSDHGHSYFVIVCIASVCAAATAMAVAFLKSRAASGDAFWSRALGTRKQRRGGGGLDE